MKVLVACEFSGIVRDAFAAKGHDAWSCDLLPTERPGNHIQGDAIEAIHSQEWDLLIGHPPCTYLTVTGNSWFNIDKYGERAVKRIFDRHDALRFVLKMYYSGVPKIAIENPIGYLSTAFRKPDQIIQPYYFGDPDSKSTCLWLKNLQPLKWSSQTTMFEQSDVVAANFHIYADGRRDPQWHMDSLKLPPLERMKLRSKTFQGIANAMAEQWG